MKKLVCLLVTVLLLFSCAGAEISGTFCGYRFTLPDGFTSPVINAIDDMPEHRYYFVSDNTLSGLQFFVHSALGDGETPLHHYLSNFSTNTYSVELFTLDDTCKDLARALCVVHLDSEDIPLLICYTPELCLLGLFNCDANSASNLDAAKSVFFSMEYVGE